MSFTKAFEKMAGDQATAEAADRADVTTHDTSDKINVHASGAKNQLARGRGGAKSRSSGQAKSGIKTDTFSQEKEFIPERMTHFKRWENSRYSGGGGSVF